MEELKSCPFCNEIDNSDIELYGRSRLRVYSSWVVDRHIYFVKCEACGARGPYFFTEKEARAAWNARKELDELPEWLIARINELREFILKSKYSDWKYSLYSDSEQFHILQCEIDEYLGYVLSFRKPEVKE